MKDNGSFPGTNPPDPCFKTEWPKNKESENKVE